MLRLLLFTLAFVGQGSPSFLDLEELESTLYNVDILDQPLSIEYLEELNNDGEQTLIKMTSKHGQKYVCKYTTTLSAPLLEETNSETSVAIPDLLESMRDACFIKHKDWWSYEFCYGKEITQFHVQNGFKSGQIISLGKYSHDYKWATEDVEKTRKSITKYHTQYYVNGTACDLTNQPRKTEIRFSCMEGESDHIGAITEHEACSYIIFVYTAKVCHHPYLKPTRKARPSPIECQPLVTQAVYDQYLQEQQIQKLKQQAERRSIESRGKRSTEADGLSLDARGIDINSILQTVKERLGELNIPGLEGMDVEYVDIDDESRQDELINSHDPVEEEQKQMKDTDQHEPTTTDHSPPITDDKLDVNEYTRKIREFLNSKQNKKLMSENTKEQINGDNDRLQKMLDLRDRLRKQKKALASYDEEDEEELKRELKQSSENYMKTLQEYLEIKRRLADSLGVEDEELSEDLQGPISMFKENMKHMIGSKFNDMIRETRREMQANGEDTSDISDETIRQRMDEYLNKQLDTAEEKEKFAYSEMRKSMNVQSQSEKAPKAAKKEPEIKIEIVPQKLEMEVLDESKIDPNHEYYDEVKKQTANLAQNEDGAKRVIALIKPMAAAGSRREEKSHNKLSENYNKKWKSKSKEEL